MRAAAAGTAAAPTGRRATRPALPIARALSACSLGTAQGLLCVAGVGLLRRDGDAAGAHRGLLRRPRLRRGARRADAVADAGAAASSAGWSPAGSATASAACARCCWARRCRCVALLLFLPFDGLVSLYVVSALFGLFQGGIVPSLRDHRARALPARRSRRARRHGADVHAVRHGARRLDVGQGLRPDGLATTPPSSTASRGTW